MGYFPLCVDISDKKVILVGNGRQIREKKEKLKPFCANLIQKETLTEADLCERPAFVVVGDLPWEEAAAAAGLCTDRNIPVNVVDRLQLCTFIFPSVITAGNLTVTVSTGGKVPSASVYLRKQIQELLPEKTDEILDWLGEVRPKIRKTVPTDRYAEVMREITAAAFEKKRVLSWEEVWSLQIWTKSEKFKGIRNE